MEWSDVPAGVEPPKERVLAVIRPTVLILSILTLIGGGAASAQSGAGLRGVTMELETRARWLHGSQKPDLVPDNIRVRWIRFDSVTASAAGGLAYSVTVSASPEHAGVAGRIETDPRGSMTWVSVASREPPALPDLSGALRRSLRLGRYVQNGEVVLPEDALWDLVPRAPPELRDGARWSDTVRLGAERDGQLQEYTVERVSVILRDTVIGSVRLWIIADSAKVEYSERRLEVERSLDTLAVVERKGAGVIRGRHLYDPASRLFQMRRDTTAIVGAATLIYPDGRRFATAARYERERAWRMYDAPGLEARARQLEAERERTALPLVPVPRNERERRLRAGDAGLADSLLAAWRRTSDADERRDIEAILRLWAHPDLRAGEIIDSVRFAVGDTASAVDRLRRDIFNRPLSLPEIRLLLRFQADPGLALAHGLERDWLYIGPAEALLRRPPAATADPAAWPCAPEACRAIARQWEDAEEPRLRDLGLLTHFLMEPDRWERTFTARAAAGSPLAHWALDVLEGRSADGARPSVPIPGRGAQWQAWRDWLGPGLRPDEQGLASLRFLEARSGRDVVAELRRGLERVTADSATLIFGSLLLALDARKPDPDEVARRAGSGSPALLRLARQELDVLFRDAEDADSATARDLADRALAIYINDVPEWPRIEPLSSPRQPAAIIGPVLLLEDGLPPGVASRWSRQLQSVTLEEWNRMPPRRAGTLVSVGYARVAGPFAWIQVARDTREERAVEEAPRTWASGVAWTLMRTRAGWVIVAESIWAT